MANAGVVDIGWLELLLATGFVVLAGGLSLLLDLGLVKDITIATVRTYVQLLALGFVLTFVFAHQRWWLTVLYIFVMTVMAAWIILSRAPDAPKGIFASSAFSMALTGFIVTFAVTGLVVRVQPWYRAQYVIPIAGMVVGNSMTGIALALERMFADLELRAEEVRALLALGATPAEAARPSVRSAVRAGAIPTISSMAAVGIVFIPGMMTGQILAGADPVRASKYQIVVMLMVSAAELLGSVMAVLLSYRHRFTAEGVYLERGFRGDAEVPDGGLRRHRGAGSS